MLHQLFVLFDELAEKFGLYKGTFVSSHACSIVGL